MTEAQFEHRSIQQRLCQHVARIARGHHVQDVLERKTMLRVERNQTRVVDRRGLNFEIETLTEAFSDREAKPSIEADSERRMDDDLRSAEPVEEALDDDRILARNSSQSRHAAS